MLARMLLLAALCWLTTLVPGGSLSNVSLPASTTPSAPAVMPAAPAPFPARVERAVFLAGGLTEKDAIALTANHAASGHPGVVLFDGPKCQAGLRQFLVAHRPEQIIPIGSFPDGLQGLEQRIGQPLAPPLAWERGPGPELWRTWFTRADQVVVTAAEPRRLLLQAACLAGSLRAPLWVLRGPDDRARLSQMLGEWQTRRVLAAGLEGRLPHHLAGVHVIHLPDEEAVRSLHWRQLGETDALVVANPTDTRQRLTGMSVLAPMLAIQHHAPLLLTDAAGDDVGSVVNDALRQPKLRGANHLLLAADLQAIPMERRLNPVPGKDAYIEMEPLTPAESAPYSFATGRLFHEDPGVVLVQLARQRLLAERPADQPQRALVVSNPGDSLPLLEMFSRSSARELAAAGYQTTTLLGEDVSAGDVRRLLPRQNLFLWEGHHSTLIKDYGFADWNEPLPPSFHLLQSCLALTDAKTHHLFERGSLAVAGSSTRIYSATGGSFALAYVNALLHDQQSLGGGLRQAKNFLLAYALLKEKRLGKDAKLTGANQRSAWAFTLWGDPTLQLPLPARRSDAVPRAQVKNNTIIVPLANGGERISSTKYETRRPTGYYMGGLLTPGDDAGKKELVPLIFTEVVLPKAPPHLTPRLRTKLPGANYVFCWDERRRAGWLLIAPRARDAGELRFQVSWESSPQEVKAAAAAQD